eukprot:Pgem_evm1s19880
MKTPLSEIIVLKYLFRDYLMGRGWLVCFLPWVILGDTTEKPYRSKRAIYLAQRDVFSKIVIVAIS